MSKRPQPKPRTSVESLVTAERRRGRGAQSNHSGRFEAEVRGSFDDGWESLADLEAAIAWAKGNDRTTVLSITTDAYSWVPGDADWDVGVPEVSNRESVNKARAHQIEIRAKQRVGV